MEKSRRSRMGREESDGRLLVPSAAEREQEEERERARDSFLTKLGLSFSFCCGTFWRLTAQPMTAGVSDHPVVPGPRDRRLLFGKIHIYIFGVL